MSEENEQQSELSAIELINEVTEFNEIHDFMQDDDLDRAMELIIKFIVRRGEIDRAKIPYVIVELQALATKFALLASYYGNMGKGGVREVQKKNMMYTAKESIGKLVDSLKYMQKDY